MSQAERQELVTSILFDAETPLQDGQAEEPRRPGALLVKEEQPRRASLGEASVTLLQELSQPLAVESLDEPSVTNSSRCRSRRSSAVETLVAPMIRPSVGRKRSVDEVGELSEPSCISLVELSGTGKQDGDGRRSSLVELSSTSVATRALRDAGAATAAVTAVELSSTIGVVFVPHATWRRAARSTRGVHAIARCRVLAAQRKEAELEAWRETLDGDERLVLEKLYALGALSRADPLPRQARFVAVTRKAGKEVDDKAGAREAAKPKRGAAVADAINSICRPKTRNDASGKLQGATSAAPVRRMNSFEVATLLGMREQRRHGANAPMVTATAKRADRAMAMGADSGGL